MRSLAASHKVSCMMGCTRHTRARHQVCLAAARQGGSVYLEADPASENILRHTGRLIPDLFVLQARSGSLPLG